MKTKTLKENNNSQHDIMSYFIEMGVMNHYLNRFWSILIEDGFEVIASTYRMNLPYISNFILELEGKIYKKQEINCLKSFELRAVTVMEYPGDFFDKTFGLRLDIFLQKQHQGIILTGITIDRPIKESIKKIKDIPKHPHFILIIREGKEEKIKKSRLRAYRKLSKMKDIKPLIQRRIIEDSLNPKKFPILKINISDFKNQDFFNCYEELPI